MPHLTKYEAYVSSSPKLPHIRIKLLESQPLHSLVFWSFHEEPFSSQQTRNSTCFTIKESRAPGLLGPRTSKQREMQKQTQTQAMEEQQQQIERNKNMGQSYRDSPAKNAREGEDTSRSPLSAFRAKEEQIERKKMEIRDKVFAQLGRVGEETKRLAEIREELEAMADPMRKEVAGIRKRIDTVNREIKPLGQNCLKKEKEYREALESFNEKSKEKSQLMNKLVELVSESERLRMKKLEEMSKTIDSLR